MPKPAIPSAENVKLSSIAKDLMSKAKELQEKAGSLPEPLAEEVLDYLEFVTARHDAVLRKSRAKVGRLRGSLKGSLSSSSEFSAAKAAEIDHEL